jgi:hypothetical protein
MLAAGTIAVRKRGSLEMRVTSSGWRPSARHHGRQRRQDRRAGGVGAAHAVDVLLRHAVVAPAEAERVQDLLGHHRPDVLAGDPVDDLADDEAARDGVVAQKLARPRARLGVAQRLQQQVAVADVVEVEHVAGEVRHPRTV